MVASVMITFNYPMVINSTPSLERFVLYFIVFYRLCLWVCIQEEKINVLCQMETAYGHTVTLQNTKSSEAKIWVDAQIRFRFSEPYSLYICKHVLLYRTSRCCSRHTVFSQNRCGLYYWCGHRLHQHPMRKLSVPLVP